MNRNILIIAANPAISSTTGWPVGFWISEVAHPYHVFTNAGCQVTIASPAGGKLEMDAWSNPDDPSGYSSWDELSREVLQDEEFKAKLKDTPSVGEVSFEDYDAIVIAGGQAPMFTFADAVDLRKAFVRFYESGRPTAALCHGVAILRYAVYGDGTPMVAGKKVTGFTNGEEDDADAAAGQQVMPWRIEDELKRLGADFQKGDNWQSFVVVDGNLITGQQNMSGEAVAKAVLEQLTVPGEAGPA